MQTEIVISFLSMKNTFLWIALLIMVALNLVLIARLQNKQVTNLQDGNSSKNYESKEESPKEHTELAVTMAHFQRYVDKLYFAGINQNWQLANFYLHEIEETAEEIEKGNIIDEGINISQYMGTMLKPSVETLENTIKMKASQDFEKQYITLIKNCNNCHIATKHDFIEITKPQNPAYTNQNYNLNRTIGN